MTVLLYSNQGSASLTQSNCCRRSYSCRMSTPDCHRAKIQGMGSQALVRISLPKMMALGKAGLCSNLNGLHCRHLKEKCCLLLDIYYE